MPTICYGSSPDISNNLPKTEFRDPNEVMAISHRRSRVPARSNVWARRPSGRSIVRGLAKPQIDMTVLRTQCPLKLALWQGTIISAKHFMLGRTRPTGRAWPGEAMRGIWTSRFRPPSLGQADAHRLVLQPIVCCLQAILRLIICCLHVIIRPVLGFRLLMAPGFAI